MVLLHVKHSFSRVTTVDDVNRQPTNIATTPPQLRKDVASIILSSLYTHTRYNYICYFKMRYNNLCLFLLIFLKQIKQNTVEFDFTHQSFIPIFLALTHVWGKRKVKWYFDHETNIQGQKSFSWVSSTCLRINTDYFSVKYWWTSSSKYHTL